MSTWYLFVLTVRRCNLIADDKQSRHRSRPSPGSCGPRWCCGIPRPPRQRSARWSTPTDASSSSSKRSGWARLGSRSKSTWPRPVSRPRTGWWGPTCRWPSPPSRGPPRGRGTSWRDGDLVRRLSVGLIRHFCATWKYKLTLFSCRHWSYSAPFKGLSPTFYSLHEFPSWAADISSCQTKDIGKRRPL